MQKSRFDLNGKSMIISRTDSIGDVVLTLPMAGFIKQYFPDCKIIFLGRNYTKDVVELSRYVDEFVSWDDKEALTNIYADVIIHVFPVKEIAVWAKQKNIPLRLGTTNRVFHWWTCNKLIRLSRKNAALHESQLNLTLLSFCKIQTKQSLESIPKFYGFSKVQALSNKWRSSLDASRINVILHPKSKGSAREWGLDNFSDLIKMLPADKFKVFISGTKDEGELLKPFLNLNKQVVDLTGKLSLKEFISFINEADAIVAASTGPLHIASALEKYAIGLYAPMSPIHPGRWMPLGKHAFHLVLNKNCNECRKTMNCHCIRDIKPNQVLDILNTISKSTH